MTRSAMRKGFARMTLAAGAIADKRGDQTPLGLGRRTHPPGSFRAWGDRPEKQATKQNNRQPAESS
jgi:hypothetical protein